MKKLLFCFLFLPFTSSYAVDVEIDTTYSKDNKGIIIEKTSKSFTERMLGLNLLMSKQEYDLVEISVRKTQVIGIWPLSPFIEINLGLLQKDDKSTVYTSDMIGLCLNYPTDDDSFFFFIDIGTGIIFRFGGGGASLLGFSGLNFGYKGFGIKISNYAYSNSFPIDNSGSIGIFYRI